MNIEYGFAVPELGARLVAARGDRAASEIAYQLRQAHDGEQVVSVSHIYAVEKGRSGCSLAVLSALVKVYELGGVPALLLSALEARIKALAVSPSVAVAEGFRVGDALPTPDDFPGILRESRRQAGLSVAKVEALIRQERGANRISAGHIEKVETGLSAVSLDYLVDLSLAYEDPSLMQDALDIFRRSLQGYDWPA